MKDENEIIEKLNLDYINIKNSNAYQIGERILKIKQYSRKFQYGKLLKKVLQNKRIKKYNAHTACDNDFKLSSEEVPSYQPRIAVYTCITGQYDKEILEPLIKPNNIDYYLYTDNIDLKTNEWILRKLPANINDLDNILKNRYIKMHPHELFPEYDYSIYIDGNVEVISNLTDMTYAMKNNTGICMHMHQFRDCIYDEIEVCRIRKKGNYKKMKLQVERYQRAGFPRHFGMLEATIIVTDLKNEKSRTLYDEWWKEFINSESYRDQISLQYIIWKNGLKISDFGSLGKNLYRNPKFRINIHE